MAVHFRMVHEIFMKTVAVEVARLEKASKRSRLRANLDEGVLYAAAENVYMNISRNKKSRKRIKNQSRQNSRLNSC